ncbi:hypothetical protein MFIFM68171_09049 [Madurella fahalii]|uniref:Gag protein n=1 Tax=Madurella fahalii TaxID=1157608 RepID=A0ABQ0GMB0_9PEZI
MEMHLCAGAAVIAETSGPTATTALPGQKASPPSPRLPAVASATAEKPASGSPVDDPATGETHATVLTTLTSPEVGAAKDSDRLPSREDAARYSTPSTSPEMDSARRANCKPGNPSVPAAPDGDDTDGDDGDDDADAKPVHDTSCVVSSCLSPLPEPSKPIVICTGPSRCHARNMTRMPNPPLDLATAHNKDGPPALGAGARPHNRTATPAYHLPGGGVHVHGQLAETGATGGEPVLFAKQVKIGQPTIPYGDFRAVRHGFWKYPPPEMRESNREFDETYLKATIIQGFDMAVIKKYIDRYAEETMAFAETMEEHQDQYDTWQKVIVCKKNELENLEENRARIIRDARLLKSVLPADVLREYLGRIQVVEDTLMADLGEAQREVRRNIIRGNGMIANALRWDFNLPATVGEMRTMKLEKKAAEQAEAGILKEAITIGTRLGREEQDGSTSAAVQQFAQTVLNEKAKLAAGSNPDVKGKTENKALPDHTPFKGLGPVAHGILTTVPEWFTILDGKGIVELRGLSPIDRFEELINTIGRPPAGSSGKQKETTLKQPFAKEYHEPNRAWPLPKWRIRGGWWRCRSGPEASAAEKNCKLCHPVPSRKKSGSAATTSATPAPTRPTDAETHEMVMREIEKAMAEAHKRDNVRLRARLQEEQEEKERLRQQQEWRRSGGGFLPHELLYGRQVNDVNYTSRERLVRSSCESVDGNRRGSQRSGSESKGKGKGKSVSWQL